MRRVLTTLILVLCALSSGCGAATTHTFVEPVPLPLRIQLWPAVAVSYTDTRVACLLPADVGDGTFNYGIVDMFDSKGPIDRIAYSRVINMPCTPITIYCGYKEYGKEAVMINQTVEPVGECR